MDQDQTIRTYSNLVQFDTFKDRFNYLSLKGVPAEETFGFDRYLNQQFYQSREWKKIREEVILRDLGCDLAMYGFDIVGKIIVHHMNPIAIRDLYNLTDILLNPEYMVCVSQLTHNAIHYGDESLLYSEPITRKQNDTCPWRKS